MIFWNHMTCLGWGGLGECPRTKKKQLFFTSPIMHRKALLVDQSAKANVLKLSPLSSLFLFFLHTTACYLFSFSFSAAFDGKLSLKRPGE